MCVSVSVSRGVVGQAEVGDPDGPLVVEQQVRRLDVAVDDPLGMGVGQRLGDLDADPRRLAVVEPGRRARRLPAALLQHGVEPAAGDVLHDVEMPPLLLADAEDRHDVGVVQPSGGPGLAAEPGQVAVLGQELQRHVAVERALVRLADDPHAAPADLADDPELAPGLVRRGMCGSLTRTGDLGIRGNVGDGDPQWRHHRLRTADRRPRG